MSYTVFRVESETGSVNFLLVKEDPDPNPDPKLGQKWDLDQDPKKLVSDPQYCLHAIL
jgi:hypothetical protein